MARPVKDTPILEGKEAKRFTQAIKDNENKVVPKSDYDRAKNAYMQIKANSNSFPF